LVGNCRPNWIEPWGSSEVFNILRLDPQPVITKREWYCKHLWIQAIGSKEPTLPRSSPKVSEEKVRKSEHRGATNRDPPVPKKPQKSANLQSIRPRIRDPDFIAWMPSRLQTFTNFDTTSSKLIRIPLIIPIRPKPTPRIRIIHHNKRLAIRIIIDIAKQTHQIANAHPAHVSV
jgi:hypothetical protein